MQAPSGNISLTVDETAGNANGIFNGEWTLQEIEKRQTPHWAGCRLGLD